MLVPQSTNESEASRRAHAWIERELDRITRENALRRVLLFCGLAVLVSVLGAAVCLAYAQSSPTMPDNKPARPRVAEGDSRSE